MEKYRLNVGQTCSVRQPPPDTDDILPPYTTVGDFLNGAGIVVGVAAGALAGTGATLLLQAVNTRRLEHRRVADLRFEIEFNIKKVKSWLAMLGDYRSAVSTNTPSMFAGYFDLTRLLFAAANDMLASGLLYRHLTHDDIGSLMMLGSQVNLYFENQLNGEIQAQKQNFNQVFAAERISFWETLFQGHQKILQGVLSSLQD